MEAINPMLTQPYAQYTDPLREVDPADADWRCDVILPLLEERNTCDDRRVDEIDATR